MMGFFGWTGKACSMFALCVIMCNLSAQYTLCSFSTMDSTLYAVLCFHMAISLSLSLLRILSFLNSHSLSPSFSLSTHEQYKH